MKNERQLNKGASVEILEAKLGNYTNSGQRIALILLLAAFLILIFPGLVEAYYSNIEAAAETQFASGDFSLDFTAAEPTSYDHTTGGGAFDDRTTNEDIVESLEAEDFECGDIVTFLTSIVVDGDGTDDPQTLEIDYSFLADTTGQSGIAFTDIVYVSINYGDVGGDGSGGTDSGIMDDGGSTATLINEELIGEPFTSGAELHGTVEVDDLETGESVVLRVDVRLACDDDPTTNPTGNLQAMMSQARLVAIGTGAVDPPENVPGGEQTIPLKLGGNPDPPTATPTFTNTPTSTPTNTPTSTPTNTPTSTPTNTPTSTPTNTPTSTPTNTPTSTPTNTPTSTPTNTPTSTPTNTPTSTPTNTPTPIPPEIQIKKEVSTSADGPWEDNTIEVFVGEDVYYRFTITNIGMVELLDVELSDPDYQTEINSACYKPTNSDGLPIDLAPSESFSCVIGPIEAEYADGESFTNIATAEGCTEADLCDDDDDDATITPLYWGFTPGFWKNHGPYAPSGHDAWQYTDFNIDDEIGEIFDIPGPACDLRLEGETTLMDALNFRGGPKEHGAAQILLRAGVSALLNASIHEGDHLHAAAVEYWDADLGRYVLADSATDPTIIYYPYTSQGVIDAINTALASCDRTTMLTLAAELDGYNNGIHDINWD